MRVINSIFWGGLRDWCWLVEWWLRKLRIEGGILYFFLFFLERRFWVLIIFVIFILRSCFLLVEIRRNGGDICLMFFWEVRSVCI